MPKTTTKPPQGRSTRAGKKPGLATPKNPLGPEAVPGIERVTKTLKRAAKAKRTSQKRKP
jgi:hypothetical protein